MLHGHRHRKTNSVMGRKFVIEYDNPKVPEIMAELGFKKGQFGSWNHEVHGFTIELKHYVKPEAIVWQLVELGKKLKSREILDSLYIT